MTRVRACVICSRVFSGQGARCPDCRHAWMVAYNAGRPEHHVLYTTPEWRRLSAEVRAGATRCFYCLRPTRRLVADHVVPVDQDPSLALVRDNLRPCCIPCNTRRGRNAKLPEVAA